jgi:hypothetical protein
MLISLLNLFRIFGLASIFLYYIIALIFNTDAFANIFQPQINGVVVEILKDKKFWLILIVVPVIALLPDLTMMFVFRVFYKSPTDVGMLKFKDAKYKK